MADGSENAGIKQIADQLSSVDELAQKSRAFGTVENDAARTEALQAELRGVRQVNALVGDVLSSLEKKKDDADKVSSVVADANKLLDLWIRILSQAEHTQRLVQSTHWDGASNEQAAIEAEAFARQQEARRRAEEARERAAAREREAAAAEAKRLAAEKKPAGRGTRRGVPATRGTSGTSGRGASSSSGYGSSSSSTRGAPASRLTRGSGIGRGVFGSSRGARGRGTGS